MSNLAKYQEMAQKIEDLREQMKDQATVILREGLQDIFNAFPSVTSIGWKQYTPYFCDGDECIFGVESDQPDINEECGWDIPYDEDLESLRDPQTAAAQLLGMIGNDDFKLMFGDHVHVTFYRDGHVDISGYDHE